MTLTAGGILLYSRVPGGSSVGHLSPPLDAFGPRVGFHVMSQMRPAIPPMPDLLRVHTFFDGQNLFHAAQRQFSYGQANYDPLKLSQATTALFPNRTLVQVHFYTGVHRADVNADLHGFWTNKLQAMRRAGIAVSSRSLKYSDQEFMSNKGDRYTLKVPREKGIDLRMGLDLVRLARKNEYDLAIIFSQDTDLREAVQEVFELRKEGLRRVVWVI